MDENDLFLVAFVAVMAATVAFPFVMRRYGPLTLTSVHLSKDEARALKETFRRDRRTHAKVRPEGKALYRKGMLSHTGLALYPNGMMAKFAVGRTATYRFVPWAEISGLYPVDYGAVVAKSLVVLAGSIAKKDLQVETVSGQTYVIAAGRHSLETVVPVLQKALASRWDEVYHPEEVVERGLGSGSAYVHKLIRDRRPKPFAAGVGVTRAAPVPGAAGAAGVAMSKTAALAPAERGDGAPLHGMGTLLLEESQAERNKRSRDFLRGGLALTAFGAVQVPMAMWVSGFAVPGRSFLLPMLLWILAVAFLSVGPVLLWGSRSREPIRIFENGIEITNPITRKLFRYSWGEFEYAVSRPGPRGRITYMFKPAGGGMAFGVPGNIGGLPEAMELIRAKIANPAYKLPLEDDPGAERRGRRIELALYLMITGLLSLLGAYFASAMSIVLPAQQRPFAIGLLAPIWVAPMLAYAVAKIRRREKLIPRGADVRAPAAITALFLAVFMVSAAMAGSAPAPPPLSHPLELEPRPASSALAAGTYEDSSFSVTGSIVVGPGDTLVLRNLTLTMNLAVDRQYGIFVERGGTLVAQNVTITSRFNTANFTFELLGTASIENSTVMGLWGDPADVDYNGGMEIYSSQVAVRGTIVVGGLSNGVLIRDSDPTFEGNQVRSAGDDGIEIHNSTARIADNVIVSCAFAMYIEDASPTIENNTIQSNGRGIDIRAGAPVIQGNRFLLNRNYAVQYTEGAAHPVIGANTFTGNTRDVRVEGGPVDLILPVGIIIGVSSAGSLAFYAWVARENRRKLLEAALPTSLLPPGLR